MSERTLHPSVNGPAILEVAHVIETGRLAVERGIGFNMSTWMGEANSRSPDHTGHNCGTVACLAGTTIALFDGVEGFRDIHPSDRAAELLGLDDDRADELFVDVDGPLSAITVDQAVAALRHLAYTGEVDWSVTK